MKVDATPAYNRIVRVLIAAQPLLLLILSAMSKTPETQ